MFRQPNLSSVCFFLSAGLILAWAGCDPESTTISRHAPAIAQDTGTLVERLSELGVDRWLGSITPVTAEPIEDGWTAHRFAPTGPARCYDGSPYVASTRPGSAELAVLALGGGGACWDYGTCYGIQIAKDDSGPIGGFRENGIFADDPANPLRDAAIAYGDYCDGSVWSGDNDVIYTDPEGVTHVTYHWGLRNLSATVDLLHQMAPAPRKIIVTGASAGGYGTLMGYLVVRAAYPETPIAVLNDSGPWLFNPDLEAMLDNVYPNWDLNRFIPAECARCDEQLLFIWEWLLPRDPWVDVGLFIHLNDFTIGTGYLGLGLSFPELLRATTGDVHHGFPDRFRRYFVEGIKHTSTFDDEYYELTKDGQRFTDWVEALVREEGDWPDRP